MDLYRENLLDHYHHPRGWGLKATAYVQGSRHNPVCGDSITVQLDVTDGQVTAMRFEGHGCVISRAAASLLSEHVVGASLEVIEELSLPDVTALLGTPVQPARVECALLALKAIQQAVAGNPK